jgi:hypothetical protein
MQHGVKTLPKIRCSLGTPLSPADNPLTSANLPADQFYVDLLSLHYGAIFCEWHFAANPAIELNKKASSLSRFIAIEDEAGQSCIA